MKKQKVDPTIKKLNSEDTYMKEFVPWFPIHDQYLNFVIMDTIGVIRKGVYEVKGVPRPVDFRPYLKRSKKWSAMFETVPRLFPHLSPMLPDPKVYVENIDTLEKAAQWGVDGVCLNMASEWSPGGGVLKGSMAQEEELCRRSTLLWSLYRFAKDDREKELLGIKRGGSPASYPIPNYGAIWSPSIGIIKDRNYNLLPDPVEINVISAAAIRNPTLRTDGSGRMIQGQTQVFKEKIRTVLRLAGLKGKTKLILGAWGCGAFHCPAPHVAHIFSAVLQEKEFQGWFEEICFAILDNPKRKENNYEIFKLVFGGPEQYD